MTCSLKAQTVVFVHYRFIQCGVGDWGRVKMKMKMANFDNKIQCNKIISNQNFYHLMSTHSQNYRKPQV